MQSIFKFSILLSVVILISGCVTHGEQEFSQYEGVDSLRQAGGGTKATYEGIDFWDSGTPNIKHKIIGMLQDKRNGGVITTKNFKSDMAEKVKELGGDAVIIMGSETDHVGTYNTGSMTMNTYGGVAITKKTTRLLVVKYITE